MGDLKIVEKTAKWFEENQTKSVLVYTALVAGFTWGCFFFVFDENKVKFYEAKVSRAEAETKEVTARASVLSARLEFLEKDNSKLTTWLEGTKNSIPYYEKEITRLNERLSTEHPTPNTPPPDTPLDQPQKAVAYSHTESRDAGTTYRDLRTQAMIGVQSVSIERTARVIVNLPDQVKPIEDKDAAPGTSWGFVHSGKNYSLSLDAIDWASGKYTVSVFEKL
ncbi:hypothetical protein [Pseudomonas neuropathica]|uniref:hypothetical protein n=1 Tax=Pseudomonas neuropathica TaxID=2730425 RepID=UPI003EC07A74